jgi:rhodanese-related sulfurtransferase
MSKPIIISTIFCFSFFIVKSQKTYKEITLPGLLNKLEQKDSNMVVLDVRTKGEYYDTSSRYQQSNIGRIKGAINIPLQDFRKDPSIVHELDAYHDKDIYVICSHSYRSRVVSNLLLDSGFNHIINTRGGMTEFFRRFNDIEPFKKDFYETGINYKNISPSELVQELLSGKNPLLINVSNTPQFFWDSLTVTFYKYYPALKNAKNFAYADSLRILELAKKEKDHPVVLYNNTNYGAAELARWLANKGIANVSYLVGNLNLLYEYIINENPGQKVNKFFALNSSVNFITPSFFCDKMNSVAIIDLRHDTIFNKITKGAKYDYKHLKNAENFFAGHGIEKFMQKYPGKKNQYNLISEDGVDGLSFADELTKKGYKINWIIGGMQRWEWYMNNVETFKCMNSFSD